jgi:pyruvate dehydrogenase E2 component (dihydrolipoamide acetyltransferase)
MPTRVVMPKLGLSMKSGTISSWKVEDGQSVETGQTLFVVETEKINMEIEATASGTVKRAEPEGATLPVGALLGYILAPGEAAPELEAAATPAPASAAATPAPARVGAPAGGAAAAGGRVLASPVARKLADKLGIDLATVPGSGPGGRVVKEDVEAVAAGGATAAPAASSPVDASGTAASGESRESRESGESGEEDQRSPLTQMRRAISERMSASLRDSAQLTLGAEVDVTDLTALIASMGPGSDDAPAPTIADYLAYAVTRALRRHPGINASLDGEEVVRHGAVHLGLAVALSDGLVVPVLRDAHRLSLAALAAARRSLAEAARAGRLDLDGLSGSTFTISSLAQSRVTWFTPILNPPEAAILGVGRAVDQVRWVDGAAAPRRVLPLSLTVDHRLVDGAPAAAFLDDLALSLSEPLRLLA